MLLALLMVFRVFWKASKSEKNTKQQATFQSTEVCVETIFDVVSSAFVVKLYLKIKAFNVFTDSQHCVSALITKCIMMPLGLLQG